MDPVLGLLVPLILDSEIDRAAGFALDLDCVPCWPVR